jgi:hypothetical protein
LNQLGPHGAALTINPDYFTINTQSIWFPYAFQMQEIAVNLCYRCP